MKLELSETLKLSSIPVLPIMPSNYTQPALKRFDASCWHFASGSDKQECQLKSWKFFKTSRVFKEGFTWNSRVLLLPEIVFIEHFLMRWWHNRCGKLSDHFVYFVAKVSCVILFPSLSDDGWKLMQILRSLKEEQNKMEMKKTEESTLY